MSEQIKQSNEFSKPIYIGEWRVYDIGATTLGDLIKNNIINKHTYNPDVLKKKPDALMENLILKSKYQMQLGKNLIFQRKLEQEFMQ